MRIQRFVVEIHIRGDCSHSCTWRNHADDIKHTFLDHDDIKVIRVRHAPAGEKKE